MMLPVCMLHWTGSTAQTVEVTGQPDVMHRVEEGGDRTAYRLVFAACLFYKQWEQISIGVRPPRLYGEDV